MINDLIKISDALDEKGLKKEADFVDELIKMSSSKRTAAVQKFIDDLKKSFLDVSQSSIFPAINKKSLPEILKVIDILSENINYLDPSIPAESVKKLQDPINTLVENIVALEEGIEDVDDELKNEKDSAKISRLNNEKTSLNDSLKQQFDQAKRIRDGQRAGDKERFQEFIKLLDEKKRKRISERYNKR
ncbi:MAG: hypothetical protein WC523_03665 [Patescibacteria group bacterium]